MSSLTPQNRCAYIHTTRSVIRTAAWLLVMLLFQLGPREWRSAAFAVEHEIVGPQVRILDNQIRVTASLTLNEKSLGELRNGVTKDLTFTIDLFRVWKMWPDEFVVGKSIIRTLKSDPVTMAYQATSNDGATIVRKKFKSFESMLEWGLLISDLKIANTKDLEKGVYFVRVTVESRIRKLPPVIGHFMIFLPETEFTIRKDSPAFPAGGER